MECKGEDGSLSPEAQSEDHCGVCRGVESLILEKKHAYEALNSLTTTLSNRLTNAHSLLF